MAENMPMTTMTATPMARTLSQPIVHLRPHRTACLAARCGYCTNGNKPPAVRRLARPSARGQAAGPVAQRSRHTMRPVADAEHAGGAVADPAGCSSFAVEMRGQARHGRRLPYPRYGCRGRV